jgi:uncharacterized protein (TIGR01777 family)
MFLRKIVSFTDDFQVIRRSIFTHVLQEVAKLGDRKDIRSDLLTNRSHTGCPARRDGKGWPWASHFDYTVARWCPHEPATLGFVIRSRADAQNKILVSGASGFIAAALIPALIEQGRQVFQLTRGKPSHPRQIQWNPSEPIDPESVSGFDAIIHLAGESIFGLWTAAKKRRILDSRDLGTRHLAAALGQTSAPPRVFVSASAIGYYGNRGDEILREDAKAGTGFLAEVCEVWEAGTHPAKTAGIRVVHPRFGLVLSASGGALKRMLLPFRLGLGGKLGRGHQWWSWIDVKDVIGAMLHLLGNEMLQGPINMVAPNPVTNAEFTRTLASFLSRPAILPIPAFAIRVALGEMGQELLLSSQRVEPAKLMASGYQFESPTLKTALNKILQ